MQGPLHSPYPRVTEAGEFGMDSTMERFSLPVALDAVSSLSGCVPSSSDDSALLLASSSSYSNKKFHMPITSDFFGP